MDVSRPWRKLGRADGGRLGLNVATEFWGSWQRDHAPHTPSLGQSFDEVNSSGCVWGDGCVEFDIRGCCGVMFGVACCLIYRCGALRALWVE